jgi:hypothetical protein
LGRAIVAVILLSAFPAAVSEYVKQNPIAGGWMAVFCSGIASTAVSYMVGVWQGLAWEDRYDISNEVNYRRGKRA